MKHFLVYVIAIVVSTMLYSWSDNWEGKEWIFAVLTLGVYAWSILALKRYRPNGWGFIFLTFFMLLNVNSIFYLLQPPIITIFFSVLLGCMLIPFYRDNREAVSISWWAVVFNVIMQLEASNLVMFWFVFITTGIGALIGYQLHYPLIKRFSIVCFFMSSVGLLLNTLL